MGTAASSHTPKASEPEKDRSIDEERRLLQEVLDLPAGTKIRGEVLVQAGHWNHGRYHATKDVEYLELAIQAFEVAQGDSIKDPFEFPHVFLCLLAFMRSVLPNRPEGIVKKAFDFLQRLPRLQPKQKDETDLLLIVVTKVVDAENQPEYATIALDVLIEPLCWLASRPHPISEAQEALLIDWAGLAYHLIPSSIHTPRIFDIALPTLATCGREVHVAGLLRRVQLYVRHHQSKGTNAPEPKIVLEKIQEASRYIDLADTKSLQELWRAFKALDLRDKLTSTSPYLPLVTEFVGHVLQTQDTGLRDEVKRYQSDILSHVHSLHFLLLKGKGTEIEIEILKSPESSLVSIINRALPNPVSLSDRDIDFIVKEVRCLADGKVGNSQNDLDESWRMPGGWCLTSIR
ncbi:hypothetical protein BDN72DRAFT_404661 [Pluteus cervinus]|uniref:Uncharacterized protein n=1 Tax=Pluteus cervinus TaxID=181527 RepID=A0ACD3A973_9AGAR|nr:hypothetical protein BDN72DRAFT_404661 [Pluteus cervinus]